MAFPKPKTYKDKKYLLYISTRPCLCHDHGGCSGDVVGHHVYAGGVGMKCSDLETVPACNNHHREVEAGKETFIIKYNIDYDALFMEYWIGYREYLMGGR